MGAYTVVNGELQPIVETRPKVKIVEYSEWERREFPSSVNPFKNTVSLVCKKCQFGVDESIIGYANYCPMCGREMKNKR